LTLVASAAHAQEPFAGGDSASRLDEVIVTGTRVADRTVAESISPIDVITPEALEATGATELATALSRSLPSLNFPRPAITDGTDAVRPAQVRGLAPDQVLVLVNGKRRHTTALINLNGSQGRGSSPADLNAIPIAAIERVEVLRDGASAQYGSDAIAGVINVVLRGDASGGQADARVGQQSAGDGEQWQLSGNTGIALGGAGSLVLAGQLRHSDQTDRARPFLGTVSPTSAPAGRVVQRYGDPEIDQGTISLNAEMAMSDAVSAYAFAMASNRDVLSNGFFRPAGDPRNIPSIYPNGFLPQINNYSKDRSVVGGLRGTTASDWRWDTSFNYGANDLTFDVLNSLNRSIGPSSPTEFYAGGLRVFQYLLNADLSKSFDVGWQYPLTVSFGAEHRREKFQLRAGEEASYINGGVAAPNGAILPGAQVFPGFPPSVATLRERDNNSLYLDLEADINDQLSAAFALRYEDYSDFGSTTSGKLSARYAFSDAVALRGTLSSGFRAPSLQQQYFQSTATNFIGGVPFEVRTFAVDDPIAIALGAEPLQAEESQNIGIGLVLQPTDGLYITIDAYDISIDDRIVLSENLTGAAVQSFLQTFGIFGVTGGRYFTNAVDTDTQGVDIVGSYGWDLGDAGNVDLTVGYNYSDTDIARIAPNPVELESGGLQLQRIGRVEQGRITVGAPKDKLSLTGTWTIGNWSLDTSLSRYGEFTVLNANPTLDQTFGSEWVLDLAGSYRWDNWTFTLGADNATDAYPDEVLFANSTAGQLPYSAASPFGFNGAFVYGKVGVSW
jgi:iron complex outermembrane receptor protein